MTSHGIVGVDTAVAHLGLEGGPGLQIAGADVDAPDARVPEGEVPWIARDRPDLLGRRVHLDRALDDAHGERRLPLVQPRHHTTRRVRTRTTASAPSPPTSVASARERLLPRPDGAGHGARPDPLEHHADHVARAPLVGAVDRERRRRVGLGVGHRQGLGRERGVDRSPVGAPADRQDDRAPAPGEREGTVAADAERGPDLLGDGPERVLARRRCDGTWDAMPPRRPSGPVPPGRPRRRAAPSVPDRRPRRPGPAASRRAAPASRRPRTPRRSGRSSG